MSSIWQHPYVNVLRHFEVNQWKRSVKEGDVTTCMDKEVKCTVFKLAGVIPANNYLQLPKTGSQSLGLTGRYIYVAFKPIPERYFVAHLDVASADGLIIRISISNLFKEFKSTSTWLQFPFVVTAAYETVEYQTSQYAATKSGHGAAPSTTRWTLLLMDLQYILSIYLNRTYSYLKTIRICANTYVKGIFTSDNFYEPGIEHLEVKKLGLVEKGVHALPREMAFPLNQSENWHEKYDFIRFPVEVNKNRSDTLQKLTSSRVPLKELQSVEQKTSTQKPKPVVSLKTVNVESDLNYPKMSGPAISVLPEVGLAHSLEGKHINAKATSLSREVHTLNYQSERKQNKQSQNHSTSQKINLKPGKCKNMLEPDPILKLKKVIGFGGATMTQALWIQNGSFIVYPCHALVIAIHWTTGKQRFFVGHTDKVSAINMTRDSSILASGQSGQNCCVRIWNYRSAECLTVVRIDAALLFSLSFSESGSVLSVAGRDNHNKTMVAVWNTSRVLKTREVNLMAKAHTDVDVMVIRVSPTDDARMVSCGRNNIRLWRLKDNSLRSAPIPLGDHHAMVLTDICWEYVPSSIAELGQKPAEDRQIYACSSTGHILKIDQKNASISDVHRLLPRKEGENKRSMSSGKGISVSCIYANDTFCVTGSSDGFLRVWPLDFKHIYLEAEHDGPVSVVQMSDDGMKILAGTSTGNLGVLDVTLRTHHNLIRSHTDRVLHFSQDVLNRRLATVSADHTIRIWSLDNGEQLYDFQSLTDCPVTICYHPSQQIISVGFDNGFIRVFDIQSTSLLADHKSHKGTVTGLVYMPDGSRMFSSAADGSLCSYNSSSSDYSVMRLLGAVIAQGTQFAPEALSVSPQGHYLAYVGPTNFTVTVASTKTLDEVMKIDVTAMTGTGLIDSARRVSFTPFNHLLVVTEGRKLLKIDSCTGKLLAEVGNLHRGDCTALDVSRSGKYLITAGDNTVKVWDYQMRYDCQIFIGQADRINKIEFSSSNNELISCGEALFIWQFRWKNNSDESDDCEASSEHETAYTEAVSNSPAVCMLDTDVPNPSDCIPASERKFLRVSSADAYLFDAALEAENKQEARRYPMASLSHFPQPTSKHDDSGSETPRKAAPKPVTPHSAVPFMNHHPLTPCEPIPKSSMTPSVKKHFVPVFKVADFAKKRYAAPKDQAGLSLKACNGYNGNGRDNVVWQPETGFFAYTCGCVLVIEDLNTGSQKHLTGHMEEISTIALQYDGMGIVSASSVTEQMSSQLCFWDLSTMSCRKQTNEHSSNVVALAYSRDDRFLISLGDYKEHRINLWDTSSCCIITSTLTCSPQHSIAWDPQVFNEFVSVGDNGSVMFWLVDELTEKCPKLRVQEPQVPREILAICPKLSFTCAAYAGDNVLYIGTSIGLITAWETKKNTCILHWEADKFEITNVIAKRGRLITGSTGKKCLKMWSVCGVSELALPGANLSNTADVVAEDEFILDGFVTAMIFDDTLDMGIVGTDSGSLWYINWSEHSSIKLVATNPSKITALQYGAGEYFVTCAEDGSVRLWSSKDREQILQFQVYNHSCICAAFSPCSEKSQVYGRRTPATFVLDGQRVAYSFLAVGYSDGVIRVFDTNKAEMTMKIQPHKSSVMNLIYGSASFIISGDKDGYIAMTSTLTGVTMRIINEHKGAVITSLDIAAWDLGSTSSSLWLACSCDQRVSVWAADWRANSCSLLDWLTFPVPSLGFNDQCKTNVNGKRQCLKYPPSIAKFSPCEKDVIVYTGFGMSKNIQFYSLSTKSVIRSFPLTHWARSMDISPKGNLIAVGINERLLKLYDYHEGTFQDFIGHDDAVRITKFSRDGSALLSVVNKCLLLWAVLL